jgi:D-glycero-D-manno-heptose 1,7-bisphosphate phosphatase
MLKAVIFDRDGTLNCTTQILRKGQATGAKTDGYVLAPDELTLFPTVKPALTLLRDNGIVPFVFTQQNCIGKGLITEAGVDAIHTHMNQILGPEAAIEEFYLAFEIQGQEENPRAKPNPAMILEIMAKHRYEKNMVLVAGDSMRDCKAAVAAGVAYAWVRDDLGRISEEEMAKTGYPVFNDVLELTKHYLLLTDPAPL